jgi:hypothetical protein
MRTPTAGAQSVIAQFPQGKLVVVPGIGHSVVTADPSGCAALAVHDWMLDTSSSRTCTRPPFLLAPIGAFPKAPVKRAAPAATFALASKTLAEAEATWLTLDESGSSHPTAGLTSGTLTPVSGGFRLAGYGIVRGVTVSGTVKLAPRNAVTLKFQGQLTVGGRSASTGSLQLLSSGLSGTLGGRTVP